MDNLTHSLAGAVLGQMGLKKKTGLGMVTLIIAANIPDIDAVAVLFGGQQHLAIRRGLTHGPLAMIILPLVLTGLMIAFDRWQTRRGKRPAARLPIRKGWLLALAYIGTLSHPALDWLNSYGIRFLEPFSSRWFYGDSIFIIDVWMWAALIAGVWISRRREKRGQTNWRRPAFISFAAVCAYIFANGLITGQAEAAAMRYGLETAKTTGSAKGPMKIAVNPQPLTFWRRELLWTLWEGRVYRSDYSVFDRGEKSITKIGMQDMGLPIKRLRTENKNLDDFLFWSRMPFDKQSPDGKTVTFNDARFANPLAAGRFSVSVELPANGGIDKK